MHGGVDGENDAEEHQLADEHGALHLRPGGVGEPAKAQAGARVVRPAAGSGASAGPWIMPSAILAWISISAQALAVPPPGPVEASALCRPWGSKPGAAACTVP